MTAPQTTTPGTTTAVQTSDPTRVVPTRRISFEEQLAQLPKHFGKDGDLISSHLTAALSALFPDGEDFFVRSVRAYRDQITDPVLKRQVAGFIGQEATHGREHRLLNDRLKQLGYPTKRQEKVAKWGLGFRERISPKIANLAATAALEHFTATMAEQLMRDELTDTTLGSEPVRSIFLWHALEESEHKAVAFDVYKAVGGRQFTRVWTMNFFRFIFPLVTTGMVVLSLLRDRRSYKRGELRRSYQQLRTSGLFSRDTWLRLKDYNRPDFHPFDHDTTELETYWRNRLFGENGATGELSSLVKSAA